MGDVKLCVVTTTLLACLNLVTGGPALLAKETREPQALSHEEASSSPAESITPPAEPAPSLAAATEAPASQESAPSLPSETALAPAAAAAPAPSLSEAISRGAKSSESAVEEKPSEWVWGEIVSVNEAQQQIIIKHLDYETYEEAQMTIFIDDKTLYENVASLGEIKAGDHVTVDYKSREGAGLLAGLIVVEKKEASSVAPAQEVATPSPSALGAVVAPEAASQEQPPATAKTVAAPATPQETQAASAVDTAPSPEKTR